MISILYEDEDVLAVDKPAGFSSIPERDLSVDSVLTLMEKQLGKKIYVVHRLDKGVSGVMLFAKTPFAHQRLNRQFFERSIKKTYRALVLGRVDEGRVIDAPLRQFGSGRMGLDAKRGKASVTEFEVIERREATTLIRAFPLTGRRHQIRVHLYSIGHPVAGDMMYGDRALQKGFPRLMLHAERISFALEDGTHCEVESKGGRW